MKTEQPKSATTMLAEQAELLLRQFQQPLAESVRLIGPSSPKRNQADATDIKQQPGDIRLLEGGLAELSRSGIGQLTGSSVLALTILPGRIC